MQQNRSNIHFSYEVIMQISESTCVDGPWVCGAFNGRKPEVNDDKWIDKMSQSFYPFLKNDRKSLCT